MLKKNFKDTVLKPLLLGLLCLVLGGGLLLYYYKFAKETSTASFVVSYAVVAGAVAFVITAILSYIKELKKTKALNMGDKIILNFISYDSDVSNKNQTFYKITFKYEYLNKEQTYISKNEFIWAHVLTFKAAEHINARIYKNVIVVEDDLEKLFEDNKEKIKQIEQKYQSAYSKVDEILK